jgi:hypothetical protein
VATTPIPTEGDNRDVSNPDNNESSTVTHDPSSHASTWKAILACALALQNDLDHHQKLYVSSVIHFLGQAARLPPPEECMHHDSHQQIHTVMEALTHECSQTRKQFAKLLDSWGQDGVDVDALRKQLELAEKNSVLIIYNWTRPTTGRRVWTLV